MTLATRKRLAWWTALLLLLISLALLTAYHPLLPDRIATHFAGAGGEANGWTQKTAFAWIWAATLILVMAATHGSALLLPRLPVSMISLPHGDRWLSDRYLSATLDHLQTVLLEIGNLTLAFLVFVQYQILDANVGPGEPVLAKGFYWALAIYLGLTVSWVVTLIGRYRQAPPESVPDGD